MGKRKQRLLQSPILAYENHLAKSEDIKRLKKPADRSRIAQSTVYLEAFRQKFAVLDSKTGRYLYLKTEEGVYILS